jgi:hypothetical protein
LNNATCGEVTGSRELVVLPAKEKQEAIDSKGLHGEEARTASIKLVLEVSQYN